MDGQKGLTLTGMLVVSVVGILVLLLGFKILPVYLEYFAIEKHFKAMAADPRLRGANRRAIETAYAARASVDDLRSMDPQLIEVTKQGDEVIVSAEYSVKVPLFRNVAACFDFKPTSK
jgi:Domain of unknown function (DUF4845)